MGWNDIFQRIPANSCDLLFCAASRCFGGSCAWRECA
ncbi:hypothetical protein QFZ43_008541 [Streptomyces afghaniensis]|nr:hypothetical protein [Streptomyces afghaniensis]